MKRIICILMCLSLSLCLFGCGDKGESKNDVSEPTPIAQNEIRGKDVSGAVGDTVEVVFEIGKNTPVAAADFLVEYDASVLEYVETKQIYKLDGGYVMGNSVAPGSVKAAVVTLDPPLDGGDLFSVSFKILKECKKGSEVKLSNTSCCDPDYKKFDLICKGAKVFSK